MTHMRRFRFPRNTWFRPGGADCTFDSPLPTPARSRWSHIGFRALCGMHMAVRSSFPTHDVYRNLHTGTWSVRNRRTGLVVDHPTHVLVRDASFPVSLQGNAKVRAEKRKTVHAYVRGWVTTDLPPATPEDPRWVEVWYDPYQVTTFVIKATRQPIHTASWVRMDADFRVWALL